MKQSRILQASSDLMAQVLAEAMETMAFISPLPVEQPPEVPHPALRVCIDFRLGAGEVLELVAGETFGRLLAANILVDTGPGIDASTARDALRELVNVACGTLLTRLGATADEMEGMTIPTVSPFGGADEWACLLARPGTAVLDADGHAVAAWMGRAA